ncbi:MAG: hypothetical protein H6714_11330 [Myxococcales bacterium]|nr:hypothetical protein [Myxococcales bacterium]
MRVLELPSDASPQQRGQIHGETFRPLVREIATIRVELALELGYAKSPDRLYQLAARHIPLMQTWLPSLFEELRGIAEGAALSIEEVIILNHYTDLRDIDPDTLGFSARESLPPERTHRIDASSLPIEEDCTAVYARTGDGVFLGQTWDMHGSAAPYVMMLYVPAARGIPGAWLLSLTGCVGLAGLNARGVGVTINNLRSNDATVGLVWPALVRVALEKCSALEARDVILESPIGSGHHYIVASEKFVYGIETSGSLKRIVYNGFPETYLHTNHCLDDEVSARTSLVSEGTSQERYDLMNRHLKDAPIRNINDMWRHLGSHDGYPRSICSHIASPAQPHASRTCGAIVMELSSAQAWAAHGCVHKAWPHIFEFDVG